MGCVVKAIAGLGVALLILILFGKLLELFGVDEPDDTFLTTLDEDTVRLLVRQVRLAGYRCDSIHGAEKAFFSDDYIVRCNNFRYTYRIVDRGGHWIVMVE